jgi:hypothetical protein
MFCPWELGNRHRQPKALTSMRDFNALRSSNHVDGSTFPATGYTDYLEITFRKLPEKPSFSVSSSGPRGFKSPGKLPKLPFSGLVI